MKDVTINNGKQPRNPSWFAMVMNTKDGRNWEKEFKQKNPHLKVTLRGRHHDRKFVCELRGTKYNYYVGAQNDVPLALAERLAVYTEVNPRKNPNLKEGDYLRTYKAKGIEFFNLRIAHVSNGYCTAECNSSFDKLHNSLGRASVILRWSDEKQIWKVYNIFA